MVPLLPLVALFACSEVAITPPADTADTAVVLDPVPDELGRELFDANCARCHVDGGAPRMSDVVPTLSDDGIASTIAEGPGAMPAFDFDDAEIDALVAYLRATWG